MTATNSLQYFQFNFHTFGSTYIRFIYYNMINKFSVTVTTSLRICDVLVLCDHGYDTFRVFVFFFLTCHQQSLTVFKAHLKTT